MYWANFLHFYQPPTQKPYWVKKIANECYRVLVRGWLANPRARFTLNINAGLTELFHANGCDDVIAGLRELAERGQIEFTASAKYHPFLPLMPEQEIRRQIALNTETNAKFFGKSYNPKGFFPPEMGYSRKVADVVRSLGYQWIIVDELAYSGRLHEVTWDTMYTLTGADDFYVFFRERDASFKILSAEVGVNVFSSDALVTMVGDRVKTNQALITAMDGETFGHHRPGLEVLLFGMYESKLLEPVTLSELPGKISKRQSIDPRSSSWALMKRDIEENTPFSRWSDDNNAIHRLQWQLTDLAIHAGEAVSEHHRDYAVIRDMLDQSLHSDQYWWASAMPWWSVEMIEAGAKQLKDVVMASPAATAADKQKAENFYRDILFTAFEWQRSGKVEQLAKEADEDVTQRISTDMPYIPAEEFDRLVNNLKHQMESSAKHFEYERAAQLRDRIKELELKKDQLTEPKK